MDKLKKGSIVLLVIIVMGVIPFVLGCNDFKSSF